MSTDKGISKREKKAQKFKQNKSKEEREEEKTKKRERDEESKDEPQEPKKKRKTRRGKKNKSSSSSGARFIIFVGNLPYKVTEDELLKHFKKAAPDKIRIRQDKGIAFVEFDKESEGIQKKMDLALKLHHTLINGRKINVELTVGGGGNSENRKTKLKKKNENVYSELNQKVKKKQPNNNESPNSPTNNSDSPSVVHPSRAALIR